MKRKMHKAVLSIIGLGLLLILVSCPNTVLTLSSLTPDTKVYHMPDFTLTATGANFTESTVIVFNGIQKSTVVMSEEELQCRIFLQDIATGGVSIPVVAWDTVSGKKSGTLYFNVKLLHDFPNYFKVSDQVSQNCPISRNGKIDVDLEKNINIVWGECDPVDLEGYVYFIRSEDLGLTWIKMHELPQPCNLGNFYPAIAVDTSNINIVYARQTSSDGLYDLYFLRSTDRGDSWSSLINLTWNFAIYAKYSDIGLYNYNIDKIAVVFNSYMLTAECNIFFIHSDDAGSSWSAPVNISNTPEHSRLERMAVDTGGRVSVVWLDSSLTSNSSQIFFNHSPDFGVSWGNPIMLSFNDVEFRYPDIAVDRLGAVYIIWEEQINNIYHILFRRSDNGGLNWQGVMSLADHTSYFLQAALAVDDAGNVNLYYYRSGGGAFYRRSIDRGSTWEPSIPLQIPPGYGDITLDYEGNIYLTTKAGSIIYFTHSQQ